MQRIVRSVLLFPCLLIWISAARAQVAAIIPASERVDWTYGTNVGVRGGMPLRTTVYTTIAAGASAAAINAALAACPGGQVVQLSAGDYPITDTISIPSRVVLRGAGLTTRVLGNFGGTMIVFKGDGNGSSAGSITAGYAKGSTTLTLAGGSLPVTGDLIDVFQDNENWVFNPDGTPNAIYATYRVESLNGSIATIWPALIYGSSGFNPSYKRRTGTIIESAGLENLKIVPGANNTYPVGMSGCYNCWVSSVEIDNVPYCGIFMYACLACDIHHVDVRGAIAGGDGYGVDMDNQTRGNTAIAVYNCIFDGLYHGIITSGQQGCLFAYNYSVNEHATSGVQFQTAAFNATHGAEGMMSLWEGNYGNYLTADRIHGAAAYQTLWRNRFHGQDAYTSPTIPYLATARGSMIDLAQGSYWWHAVGNVLGDPWSAVRDANHAYSWTAAGFDAASSTNYGGIFMLGYSGYALPLDATVGSTFIKYSNYSYYHSATQDMGASTVDNSLAWPAKPAWWGTLAWPAYDPASPMAYGNTAASRIPAGYRYINGVDPATGAIEPPTNAIISITVL